MHGGTPAIKPTTRRARAASSFRAVWEPVPTDFGASRTATAASAAGRAPERSVLQPRVAWATDATSPCYRRPHPAPALDFGELAHPVVDAAADMATLVRQQSPCHDVERLLQRALEIMPFALAAGADLHARMGSVSRAIAARDHAARVRLLLGLALDQHGHPHRQGLPRHEGDLTHRLAPAVRRRDADRPAPTLLGLGRCPPPGHHPTYKESVEKLSATLGKLAESEVAHEKLLVVIAMEEADEGAPARFEILQREFGHSFLAMIGTTHPDDIAGEVRGKSSNEAWAAKKAKRLFCDEMGFDIDQLTVTSCDADTLFHPRYFSALTYYFATNPKRYRTFWQGPIFYYNNVWDVPAPLRIQNSLGGINHLAKLVPQVHGALPAIHLQPQHAHVPRRRLLGRRRCA